MPHKVRQVVGKCKGTSKWQEGGRQNVREGGIKLGTDGMCINSGEMAGRQVKVVKCGKQAERTGV